LEILLLVSPILTYLGDNDVFHRGRGGCIVHPAAGSRKPKS
jgi:hypothetical protein